MTRLQLAFATQAIDADHPVLAQSIDMVRALAERCERVDVLCDYVGRHDLPSNVRLRTFGGGSRLGRGVRFERGLASGRPDAFLAHMVPLFVLLAAPVYKPLRVPILLWYTHWRASRTLRVADRLCDRALSVDRRSYPLPSAKVRAIGHAIDLSRFDARAEAPERATLRLLALGKTEPWKGFPLLLDALERAVEHGLDAALEIRGPQLTDAHRRHRRELQERAAASDALRNRVVVADAIARDRIPELIREADALVSPTASRPGGEALDKVVFEAAACAVPVVACNPALAEPLGAGPVRLFFRQDDAADLTETLLGLGRSNGAERTATGKALRRWVEEAHSLDGWADAVLEAVHELRAS